MVQKAHAQSYSPAAHPLPEALAAHKLTGWMHEKGWHWFPHQVAALETARAGKDVIVFAPTGAGKTLSGFLPSFIDLAANGSAKGLHTLYISPLKALAVDVHRNIGRPVEDLKLPVTYETRTGDTPSSRRQRQKHKPPDMLMTTPESLALLLSYEEAPAYFRNLRFIIIDELHALFGSKRGDLLSLGLARLASLAPGAVRIGLSATIAEPERAKNWLCRRGGKIVKAPAALAPQIDILDPPHRIPWGGHMAAHALPAVYEQISKARMSVVFVNTRAQAEFVFQGLWRINDRNLKIAIHHGSLERELRRKVEARMAAGALDCVVATSSLDLGLDWADVDLVIQIGAPKGVSRLLQRVGRSNHRLDEPSRALLVPTNRFEYIECVAARDEIGRGKLDGTAFREGGLDVLAQHIFGTACSAPFDPDALYTEVISAAPYDSLTREDFDDVISFVKDGGYALRTYEQYSRLIALPDGRYGLRDPRDTRRYRMNIGTIVEAPMLRVKLGNRTLGSIEENFILNLSPGDTFLFGGEVLAYQGINNASVMVSKSKSREAAVPSYLGGKMPLSTHLSYAVRHLIGHPRGWKLLPEQIREWLTLHKQRSSLPDEKNLVVETFPYQRRHYLVAYTFAGYNANQTLGFLVMRRLKRAGAKPIGFTMTDYGLAVWCLRKPADIPDLFSPEIMYEDFEEWLRDTPLLKRLFRDAAVISGLVERNYPGQRKTGRQVLFSSDLIFDVLLRYEPHHVLLRTVRKDATQGLIDADRLSDLLHAMKDHIVYNDLDRISPMAVPLILQLKRESLSRREMEDTLLEDLEQDILHAAAVDTLA